MLDLICQKKVMAHKTILVFPFLKLTLCIKMRIFDISVSMEDVSDILTFPGSQDTCSRVKDNQG